MIYKINTKKLIEALQKKVVELKKEDEKNKALFEKNVLEYKKNAVKTLREYADRVEKASTSKDVKNITDYDKKPRIGDFPSRSENANIARYEATIARLALVDEETVSLNEAKDSCLLGLI